MKFPVIGLALLLALVAAGSHATLAADAPQPTPPPGPWIVLARMAQRNPSLASYRTRVHVDIRMLNFPFLAPKLDGTTYYKRPDIYEVVFDRMPSYARGFQRIFTDIGNPQAWQKNQNITVAGMTALQGRAAIVLRLTKKIHSDILDHTLAYVDAYDYSLVRMEWYYTNGGKITMSQYYRIENNYSVLSQQHGTIDIPHVHAIADATYGAYQTNVPIHSGTGAP
jgi:hypothetical protein